MLTTASIVDDLRAIVPQGEVFRDLPMAPFCSFRCGGLADIAVFPGSVDECKLACCYLKQHGVPLLVLGGGANVLIADAGVRGAVLLLQKLNRWTLQDGVCHAQVGVDISSLAWSLGCAGWGGLDYFYAMPGSLGGALFMNARCYGGEVASLVGETLYLEASGVAVCESYSPGDWAYKYSPYQNRDGVILSTQLRLQAGEAGQLRRAMLERQADRKRKGHFRCPNAGSVFKNNHAFGAPSGQIIDQLGLRGLQSPSGLAAVAPWHGNIIINRGGATAAELRELMCTVKERVFKDTGLLLEEEIRFVGAWPAKGD